MSCYSIFFDTDDMANKLSHFTRKMLGKIELVREECRSVFREQFTEERTVKQFISAIELVAAHSIAKQSSKVVL